MTAANAKHLRWIKQVEVPARPAATRPVPLSSRDRLVAALADRPRTVAQLAHAFGLSQPTMLEQVRRALAEGLIVETEPPRLRGARERSGAAPPINHDERRRYFKLTTLGQDAARLEARRLHSLVSDSRTRRLLSTK